MNPPRTIMEVYKALPEGTRAELIEGAIYMSPSPKANHQRISRQLIRTMSDFVEANGLGEMFAAQFDVFLDEHSNAVQPDLIFVSAENASIVQDVIHGVPDLLVEILSPSNPECDTVRKKRLYEKFGVKEYWIIDANTKETIGYSLQNGTYVECGRYYGHINSVLLKREFKF